MEPTPIHGLTRDQLIAAAKARLPRGGGVARKVHRQVFREGRYAPNELGLSDGSVQAWREHFSMRLPEVAGVVEQEDDVGTTGKAVLRLHDGLEIECVRIPMGRGKHTLCVSSQVGCKMGCGFCETARMGLLRNLAPDEVIAQLLVARHRLGWSFGNVVFMGMGEALDNADALIQALHVLTDPAGLGFAHERLTVCTVGRVDGIRRLAELGWKRLNLSVSLNAASDPLRSRLMPINRTTPLGRLQEALVAYRPRRNFCLGVNYCLLPGINDTRQDVAAIAAFCAPIGRVLVNVIPYNPGGDPLTRAPDETEIERFVGWLREEGLPVRRRVTKGREVMAACGQLGNVALRDAVRRERRQRSTTAADKLPTDVRTSPLMTSSSSSRE